MPSVSKKNTINLSRNLRRKMRGGGQHTKARGPHPAYPPRFSVLDAMVDWSVELPGYQPALFTHSSVLDNDRNKKKGGWADPADVMSIREELKNRITYHPSGLPRSLKDVVDFVDDMPQNPQGRTGLRGRGLLGKWGPNHAADPIVTRYDPERPSQLQIVAIQRKDTGDWALPGGMVDPGETVSVAVRREFTEEAGNVPDHQKKLLKSLVDDLFASGKQVYCGCVDDPRNTDNAWMETTAFHFHCNEELATMLPLRADLQKEEDQQKRENQEKEDKLIL